jgi:SAM-dependent methyltransferase
MFKHLLSCKDYTVSQERFDLDQCLTCGLVFTNPRPKDSELNRYYQSDSYISHSNKATSIVDRVYKIARQFTLKWKYDLLQKHSRIKPASILDYGCGTGAFLHECQQRNMKIAGVEPNATARQQAQALTGVEIQSELVEAKDVYDAITLWHVLEHVSDLNATLEKLRSLLSENGTMFIAVPNHQSQDARKYGEHWAAYDVPRHLWHFDRQSMTRLLNKHNMKVGGILPMILDAYYVSLLSEKYRSGKQGIIGMGRAIVRATQSNIEATRNQEYSSLIYIAQK